MAIQTYTEFYITQGAGANAANGGTPLGTNDGPVYSSAVVSSDATGTILTDNGPLPWSGCATGMWVGYNDGVNYAISKITNIAGVNITISPAVGPLLQNEVNQTAKVGGAFNLPSTAATRFDAIGSANYPAGTNPPRINVKRHAGDAYTESAIISMTINNWAVLTPCVWSSYNTTPGDINHWSSCDRAVIDADTNNYYFTTTRDYVHFHGLKLLQTLGSTCTRGFWLQSGAYANVLLNCELDTSSSGQIYGFYNSATVYSYFGRCLVNRRVASSGGTPYSFYLYDFSNAQFCESYGPGHNALVAYGYGFHTRQNTVLTDCISANNHGGIRVNSYYGTHHRNTIVNNYYGINAGTAECISHGYFIGNIIAHNTTGIQLPAAAYCDAEQFNLFYGNTTTIAANRIKKEQESDVTGTRNPCRDYTGNDFRLDPASEAYNGGIPGVMPSGGAAFTGSMDIGALQHTNRRAVMIG